MNTFPKSEKLCGKIRIATLFREGKRFVAFPLRITVRIIADSEAEPAVLIWAPKSLFKHAVDRNRCRRLIREAYRLNSTPLREWCHERHCSIHLAMNYMDKDIRPYADIERAVQKTISRICR